MQAQGLFLAPAQATCLSVSRLEQGHDLVWRHCTMLVCVLSSLLALHTTVPFVLGLCCSAWRSVVGSTACVLPVLLACLPWLPCTACVFAMLVPHFRSQSGVWLLRAVRLVVVD